MRFLLMAVLLLVFLAAGPAVGGTPAATHAEYRLVRFDGVTNVLLPLEFPGYPLYVAYPCPPLVAMRAGTPYHVCIPTREDRPGRNAMLSNLLVYREEDPSQLTFEVRGCCLLMNGKPVLLFRGENGADAVAWLSSAPEVDLESLRGVELSPELLLYGNEALDRLAKHNIHVGLALPNEPSENKGAEHTEKGEEEWVRRTVEAVNKFRPHIVTLPLDILSSPNLEDTVLQDAQWLLLGFPNDKPEDGALLLRHMERASSVRHLLLGRQIPDINWQRFEKLRSLVLWKREDLDLRPLATMPNLESLSIAESQNIDVTPLGKIPNLKVLNLIGTKSVENLSHLDDAYLTWFTPPSDITSEQLGMFLRQHPELRVLVLYQTEDLHLDVLRSIPDLRVLVLATEVEDLDAVTSLEHLELLVLHQEYWKDGAYWPVTLHRKRPDIEIALGGGLCLGSGWILLLVPATALAIWSTRKRRRG
jgi:hypothetical protein